MGLFSFFRKPKQYFTAPEMEAMVEAIRLAEQQTSGEIRVFVESKNPLVSTIDRAAEVFYQLKMQETDNRNAVLLYLAMDHHEVALFGDEGIHAQVGTEYWHQEVKAMIAKFSGNAISNGIISCIQHIGQTLKEKFPYDRVNDKNELPDEIVFGK